MTTSPAPSPATPRRRARRLALVAGPALAVAMLAAPTAPASAADYTSTCSSPLAPGLEFAGGLTVTGTAPAEVEEGSEYALTDIEVTYSAPDLGAPPGAVLSDATLTLTNGLAIPLGDSAPSVDGAVYTWSVASVTFTAGEPGPLEMVAAELAYTQDIIPVTCAVDPGDAFATLTVTAAPTPPTEPPGPTPSDPPPPGGTAPPATPVSGAAAFTG